ncbi:MAG: hypothetical protein ACI8RW_000190 [Porticoccaceae bacterium]|jgi:hypothetical protein
MSIITYHIESDYKDALRDCAKKSCDFWNKYLQPQSPIVIRLGTFTQFGNTIARAYRPYHRDSVKYGRVEFNTTFIDLLDSNEITATAIHEIGHTLGIGWDKWMTLFSKRTGRFYSHVIKKVPALKDMRVETDYGAGTTLVHWDEATFTNELMTGIKSENDKVLPVTIDVLELFGHTILERLTSPRSLESILTELDSMIFSRVEDAIQLNRDVLTETEIWEEIYSPRRIPLQN